MANEDFTTYTEVDPNSHITVTAAKCESLTLNRNESAYVYDDKGAAHFDGDFEFLFTTRTKTSGDAASQVYITSLSNDIGSREGWTAFITVLIQGDPDFAIYLGNIGGYSAAFSCADNTIRYCTLKRVGSTVTLKIYSDSDRTTLLDTLTVEDSGSYRYTYGMSSRNTSSAVSVTGAYAENLDLQESPPPPSGSDFIPDYTDASFVS